MMSRREVTVHTYNNEMMCIKITALQLGLLQGCSLFQVVLHRKGGENTGKNERKTKRQHIKLTKLGDSKVKQTEI